MAKIRERILQFILIHSHVLVFQFALSRLLFLLLLSQVSLLLKLLIMRSWNEGKFPFTSLSTKDILNNTNILLTAEPADHFWCFHHESIHHKILEKTISEIALEIIYLLILVRRSFTTALVVMKAVPEKGDIALIREGYLLLSS